MTDTFPSRFSGELGLGSDRVSIRTQGNMALFVESGGGVRRFRAFFEFRSTLPLTVTANCRV